MSPANGSSQICMRECGRARERSIDGCGWMLYVQLFLGRQWVNSIKIELEIDLTRTQHGALARKKDRKCLPGDKKLWDGPKLENGEN